MGWVRFKEEGTKFQTSAEYELKSKKHLMIMLPSVIVTSDYSVEIFKYLSLKTIFSLSLCCHEWFNYIHEENQHLWKMLYHRYQNSSNNNNNNNNQNWKEQVRELLNLKFARPLKHEGSGILTNNDRTMELSETTTSWTLFPLTKVVDLEQYAGSSFCFEVVLDKFAPRSAITANYYSVTIGVAYWNDEFVDPGSIIGYSHSTGVAFFCGNHLVYNRGSSTLTQDAVGDYEWPKDPLSPGDVIGVKVFANAYGTQFNIHFYVNGVKRILNEPLGRNISAKHVQPHISCIGYAKVTVQGASATELEDRTRFRNRTTEINEQERSTVPTE